MFQSSVTPRYISEYGCIHLYTLIALWKIDFLGKGEKDPWSDYDKGGIENLTCCRDMYIKHSSFYNAPRCKNMCGER